MYAANFLHKDTNSFECSEAPQARRPNWGRTKSFGCRGRSRWESACTWAVVNMRSPIVDTRYGKLPARPGIKILSEYVGIWISDSKRNLKHVLRLENINNILYLYWYYIVYRYYCSINICVHIMLLCNMFFNVVDLSLLNRCRCFS